MTAVTDLSHLTFGERLVALGIVDKPTPQPPAGNVVQLHTPTAGDSTYGLGALRGLCDDIAEAGHIGGRDVTFNRACLRAGELIRRGDLTRATAESALREAGLAVTDAADFTAYKVEEKLSRVIDEGEQSGYETRRGPAPLEPPPLRTFTPEAADTAADTAGTGEEMTPEEAEQLIHARQVLLELRRIRAVDDAQTLHRAEKAAKNFREPSYRPTLTAELLMPDEPVQYAIDELLPVGGNALLAAQYKTGKTTVVGDYARAFADSTPFLGRFAVNSAPGRVAIWNYELSETQYRRWLRELGIRNTDAVVVLHLRGFRLPITSPTVEDWIVRWLEEHEVSAWIPDPFARAAVGTDENSNTEVGIWLDTLDVIKERAGVRDLILPTHTGRAEQEAGHERARGATRLDDWADVRWLLTKDDNDNRFFRATGRDVDLSEELLTYDQATRTLRYGGGDRQWVRRRAIEQNVLDYINAHPGCTSSDLERGVTGKTDAIRGARESLVRGNVIRAELGDKNARLYYANQESA